MYEYLLGCLCDCLFDKLFRWVVLVVFVVWLVWWCLAFGLERETVWEGGMQGWSLHQQQGESEGEGEEDSGQSTGPGVARRSARGTGKGRGMKRTCAGASGRRSRNRSAGQCTGGWQGAGACNAHALVRAAGGAEIDQLDGRALWVAQQNVLRLEVAVDHRDLEQQGVRVREGVRRRGWTSVLASEARRRSSRMAAAGGRRGARCGCVRRTSESERKPRLLRIWRANLRIRLSETPR